MFFNYRNTNCVYAYINLHVSADMLMWYGMSNPEYKRTFTMCVQHANKNMHRFKSFASPSLAKQNNCVMRLMHNLCIM